MQGNMQAISPTVKSVVNVHEQELSKAPLKETRQPILLCHVIKHQDTKEPIKVSETVKEFLDDNVNEIDDEKH